VRINRVVVGVFAMPVVIATGVGAAYAEIRFFGHLEWRFTVFLAFASGCGVFLLADKLGVLAEPHQSQKILSLRADDESESRATEVDSSPIVPR
jgi:hypothetical protein